MSDLFCETCLKNSSDERPSQLFRINGCGTTFLGDAEPCDECGSTIRTVWVTALFIPVAPDASYRTIQVGFGSYVARKVELHEAQVYSVRFWTVVAFAAFICIFIAMGVVAAVVETFKDPDEANRAIREHATAVADHCEDEVNGCRNRFHFFCDN